MSSRVSLPLTSRPIGLALPASTFRPCGLVLAVLINGWCRVLPHTSSHALVVAFGTCPPQSSPRLRRVRLGRLFLTAAPRKRVATTWRHHLTEPSALRSTTSTSLCRPSLPHCCDRMPLRAFGLTLPSGPFDACQPAFTRPSVRPCGRSSTDRDYLSRFLSCHEPASHISDWIVHGHPPFRGFSPFVAAGSSRIELSPLPFPTLRCRGSEDSSCFGALLALRLDGSLEWVRSLTMALFTPPTGRSSPGRFPPSRMTFRPRPTLLQGSSHGLFSSTRAWDSPQGCPRASSYAQIYVRSSEFQRTGSPPGFTRASLRGVPAASHPP